MPRLVTSTALFLLLLTLSPSTLAMCVLAPIAADDQVHAPPDLDIFISPLSNDSDPQGLPLSAAVNSSTCPGSTSLLSTSLIRLSLPSPLSAPCTVTYTASNGETGGSTATITIEPRALLFRDSFESGSVSAWSDSAP